MNAKRERCAWRRWALWAAVPLVFADASGLAAQTVVRLANLQPRPRQIFTRPLQPVRLTIDVNALNGYGGISRVRFRLVSKGAADSRNATSACMTIPTRTITARMTDAGELDFGPVFRLGDLNVSGGRLEETLFYLVAEVAGSPGDDLVMRPQDLNRYVLGGVRLVVRAPPVSPNPAQLKKIQPSPGAGSQSKPGGTRQCWTVS